MDAANAYSTRQDLRNARGMAYAAAARNDVIRLYGDDRKFASVTRLVAMARELGISPDSGKSSFLKIRTAGKLHRSEAAYRSAGAKRSYRRASRRAAKHAIRESY